MDKLFPAVKDKIVAIEDYKEHKKIFDCAWLLENVKLTASGIHKP